MAYPTCGRAMDSSAPGSMGSGACRTQHQRPCQRRPCVESEANEARDRSGSIRRIVLCVLDDDGSTTRGGRPWSTCVGGSRDALSDGAHLVGKFSSRFVPIDAIRHAQQVDMSEGVRRGLRQTRSLFRGFRSLR